MAILVTGVGVLTVTAALWAVLRRPPAGTLALVTGGVAAVSVAASVGYAGPVTAVVSAWAVVDTVALASLLTLVVRRATPGAAIAVGIAATVAIGVRPAPLGLRSVPPSPATEIVLVCGIWMFAALAAIALGAYLRGLDGRRRRAVSDARQVQRLTLARDLHDFVAHDVTGIVLEAQAATLADDVAASREALRRIEAAGQHALSVMDRMVHALHVAGPVESGADLAELSALADRFPAGGSTRVRLTIESGLAGGLPAELSGVTYRIVAEALTNVRRHAPAAETVDIAVTRSGSDLAVTIADSGSTPRPAGEARGGHGLAGLTAAVTALGGTLTAGPAATGWRVDARLPVR
jgi:signal transduction histidine kinase